MSAKTERLLQEILNELRGSSKPAAPARPATRGGSYDEDSAVLRAAADRRTALEEEEAQQELANAAAERANDLLTERIAKLKQYSEIAADNYEVTKALVDAEKAESAGFLGRAAKKQKLQRLELDLQKELVDKLKKQIALMKAQGENVDPLIKKLQEATGQLEKMSDSQGKAKGWSNIFITIGKSVKAAAIATAGFARELATAESATAGLSKAVESFLSNPLTAPLEAFKAVTAGSAKELDILRANFIAVTADTNSARDSFATLAVQNSRLAIGFKEMYESLLALREGFDDFIFLNNDLKDGLMLQAATMERLGISNETTAESLNILTQSFGMTTNEAMAVGRSMIGLARDLELPPKVMAEQFVKIMPKLREFGDRAEAVFRRLAIASRETGLEIENITAVFGDAMNTYQGSTEAAGRLNAVLGAGIISGTELLMADTEERFRIVQSSLEMTGRSFQSLGRFEKVAFAQAAGFSSVDEAARAFGNTQDDLATKIGNTTITQVEMEAMAVKATDTMTKLRFAFLSVAGAVTPLADKFATLVDNFIKGAEAGDGMLAKLKEIAFVASLVVGVIGAIAAFAAAPFVAGIGGAVATAGAGALALGGTAGIAAGATGLASLGGLAFLESKVDDAVIKGNTVIPINSQDDILAVKPDGPVDRALGASVGPPALAGLAGGAVGNLLQAFTQGFGPSTSPAARQRQAASMGKTGDTTLVVKVMIDDRELGEAMIPHIDRRVLGTV